MIQIPEKDYILTIVIRAHFGSAFQKRSAVSALDDMLRVWEKFYKGMHTKTVIHIGRS